MKTKKSIFVVITGPSGAGKTTVTEALLERMNGSTRLITTTTREKRPNEINGVDYDFITIEEFLNMEKDGEFFEYAQVYNQYYGSLKTKLSELLKNHSTVFSVVDVEGAKTIKRKLPETLTIFIAPDSIDELRSRLLKRGCASDKDTKKRIEKSKYEMNVAQEFDIVIKNINGKLEETIDNTLMYVSKYLKNQ